MNLREFKKLNKKKDRLLNWFICNWQTGKKTDVRSCAFWFPVLFLLSFVLLTASYGFFRKSESTLDVEFKLMLGLGMGGFVTLIWASVLASRFYEFCGVMKCVEEYAYPDSHVWNNPEEAKSEIRAGLEYEMRKWAAQVRALQQNNAPSAKRERKEWGRAYHDFRVVLSVFPSPEDLFTGN